MQPKSRAILITASALALAFSVHAHEGEDHTKKADKPDCAAMDRMDHSKMDANDPVMQAMMKKCMKDAAHDASAAHDAKEPKATAGAEAEHDHDH
ncbi:MAG: hypothetical protein IT494_02000 [Gammaproteobacteria bacterium]|nr:hypothetical protein [Gammaproteobacteria bacterium]